MSNRNPIDFKTKKNCSLQYERINLKISKNLNRDRKDKLQLIQTQLDKSTSSLNADNSFEETKILEGELLRLNEDNLADRATIFKNTALLNY